MDRSVPFDLAAERATLGACLLEREAIVPAAARLTPDDFYLEKHALIFAAMVGLYERRTPPDLTTVATELRRREQLDVVGGIGFLGDLLNETYTAVHIDHYARAVADTATRRKVIEAGGQIAAIGYDETLELDELMDRAEQTVFGITKQRDNGDGYADMGVIARKRMEDMQAAVDGTAPRVGLSCGLSDLDHKLRGLKPGKMYTIAGRPGMGKTSLLLSMAYAIGEAGGRAGVVSLEMGREELLDRMCAMYTGIDSQRIENAEFHGRELERYWEAMSHIEQWDIPIDDQPGQQITTIRSRARKLHAQASLDVLFIDYLQLITPPPKIDGEAQQLTVISRGIKLLARELKIPVVALSQLSREVEKRSSRIPQLSDLRGSGSIEQDSDVVIFIYRDEVYNPETENPGIAELHIAKHRGGPLGTVACRFDAHITRFQSLERYREIPGYAAAD